MTITKIENDKELTIALQGRLDTMSAPELEAELAQSLEGVEKLVFDFSELEYISSAGLRVLLSVQKLMNTQGEMKVINVNNDIMDIFEVTGFSDFLTIEQARQEDGAA